MEDYSIDAFKAGAERRDHQQQNSEAARKGPLPRIQFCRHSLVPSYCAHCKYGEAISDVIYQK